jgi:hypothetical protein
MRIGNWLTGMIGVGLIALGCTGTADEGTSLRPDNEGLDTMGKRTTPMLNLSHIECTDAGVSAHFVLLFAGSATPADLWVVNNGVTIGPTAPTKGTGNVWHYNVLLNSSDVDITAAWVGSVTLHNPSEYSGEYNCAPPPPACWITPFVGEICPDHVYGDPDAECAAFGSPNPPGLAPLGKDDGLSGTTHTASMSALLAIVKAGQCYVSYLNVVKDVTPLPTTSSGQGISHVTYCTCPPEPAQ